MAINYSNVKACQMSMGDFGRDVKMGLSVALDLGGAMISGFIPMNEDDFNKLIASMYRTMASQKDSEKRSARSPDGSPRVD